MCVRMYVWIDIYHARARARTHTHTNTQTQSGAVGGNLGELSNLDAVAGQEVADDEDVLLGPGGDHTPLHHGQVLLLLLRDLLERRDGLGVGFLQADGVEVHARAELAVRRDVRLERLLGRLGALLHLYACLYACWYACWCACWCACWYACLYGCACLDASALSSTWTQSRRA